MNNLTQEEIDKLANDLIGKLSDSFCRSLMAYDKLSQDEINQLMNDSIGKLNDSFCRALVAYMAGYMRTADNVDDARQVYFQQIKYALKTNAQTVTFL